jgi:membrane fusion protein, heavy metal efflux system
VIDSGDLAQAYADIEKARSTLTLTKKALDRQLGLEKAGGAAIKDREQAQTDYDQAVAELERAQTRLRAMGSAGGSEGTIPALDNESAGRRQCDRPRGGGGAFLNDPTQQKYRKKTPHW